MNNTYSHRWNWQLRQPIRPIQQDQVEKILTAKGLVTARLEDAHSRSQVVLEIRRDAASKYSFQVLFLDNHERPFLSYSFRQSSESLFLSAIRQWQYPDDKAAPLLGASHVREMYFNSDSDIVTVIEHSYVADQSEKYEQTNPDPSKNWEPLPKFGDWESLIRLER